METYTAKILVQEFNITMNHLQSDQLVVVLLHGTAKVQAGVSLVHNLALFPLQKAAHLLLTTEYRSDQLSDNLLLCLIRIRLVPFLHAQFALTAEQ